MIFAFPAPAQSADSYGGAHDPWAETRRVIRHTVPPRERGGSGAGASAVRCWHQTCNFGDKASQMRDWDVATGVLAQKTVAELITTLDAPGMLGLEADASPAQDWSGDPYNRSR